MKQALKSRRVLIIHPDIDLARDNGVTLPLKALMSECPSGVSPHCIAVRRATPTEMLGGMLHGSPPAVARALPRSEIQRIRSVMRSGNFDAAILYLGTVAGVAHTDLPCVCVVQDSITRITAAQVKTSRGLRRLLKRLDRLWVRSYERHAYRQCAGVSVVSEPEARELVEIMRPPIPVHVVPNGVEPTDPDLRREWDDRKYVACSFGDFSSARNRAIASRALAVHLGVQPALRGSLLITGWAADRIWPSGSRAMDPSVVIVADEREPAIRIAESQLMLVLDPESTGIKNSVLLAMSLGVVPVTLAGTDVGVPLSFVEEVESTAAASRLIEELQGDVDIRNRLRSKSHDGAHWVSTHRTWRNYAHSVYGLGSA